MHNSFDFTTNIATKVQKKMYMCKKSLFLLPQATFFCSSFGGIALVQGGVRRYYFFFTQTNECLKKYDFTYPHRTITALLPDNNCTIRVGYSPPREERERRNSPYQSYDQQGGDKNILQFKDKRDELFVHKSVDNSLLTHNSN